MFPFTLHQLRILKAVAMQQSFKKAATFLYLSQPSLSKHIIILETKLGVKLIHRKANRISLTRNGAVLLKYSERILALCEESCRALAKSDTETQKELRIGIPQIFVAYLFPKLLLFCSQMNVQLNLGFLADSTEKIAKQIVRKKLDLALANAEIYEFLDDELKMRMEYYMTDQINFIFSSTHPFAKREILHKTDLYTLDYITVTPNTADISYLNKLLRINEIDIYQFKTIIQVDSIKSLKTAVKLGLGAAFISSAAIDKEVDFEMVKVARIQKTTINQKLFLINRLKSTDSGSLKVFTTKLQDLKVASKSSIKKVDGLKKNLVR